MTVTPSPDKKDAIKRTLTRVRFASVLLLALFSGSFESYAVDYPQATISNGQITAKMWLPDAKNGYYRSTRFDWSGAVYSVQYKGHDYYGQWFDSVDPKVINWAWRDDKMVNGSCGALEGPVEEFEVPLGWDEAKEGGTFVKIGVGVLRKTGERYNRFVPYEVVDSGKWTVKTHKDSVEFTQVFSDPELGYGYVYSKTVRLEKGKPEMVIERRLKNTGRLEIKSQAYDHNLMVIDHQAPGPDFTIKFPFELQATQAPNRGQTSQAPNRGQTSQAPNRGQTPPAQAQTRPPRQALTEIKGDQIVYMKQLSGEDQAVVSFGGYGDDPKNSGFTIENNKVGAGLKVSGNRPLTREFLWSIRTVLAMEPYIAIDVQPGSDYTWSNTYDYYTLAANK